MPYAPQNVNVYAAAFAGAMAGIGVPNGAFITDPTQADYAVASGLAAVFAQAVDTAWGAVTLPNNYDLAAITAAASNLFVRGAGYPIASPVNTQGNWTTVATALVALVQEGDTVSAGTGVSGLNQKTFTLTNDYGAPLAAQATITQLVAAAGVLDASSVIDSFYVRDPAGLFVGTGIQIVPTIPADNFIQLTYTNPTAAPIPNQLTTFVVRVSL